METPNRMNIILDMDGTLIDDSCNPRPYVHEFFIYCFRKFQTVSIWTAASREWYDEVYNVLFEEILTGCSYFLGFRCDFHFVYTGERCVKSYSVDPDEYYGIRPPIRIIKPLRKIWKAKKLYPCFTEDNTIIIDDNISTFSENYGNALHIPEYIGGQDIHMLSLIQYLDLLYDDFIKYKTVRNIEKRGWYNSPELIAQSLALIRKHNNSASDIIEWVESL